MDRSFKFRLLPVAAAVVIAAGCASESPKPATPADRMRAYAEAERADVERKQDLAEQWEKGNQLQEEGERAVKEGREKVAKAERMIREGREQIAQGQQQIQEGEQRMRNAKAEFGRLNPGLELQTSE